MIWKKELHGVERQRELTIITEMLERQLRKIPTGRHLVLMECKGTGWKILTAFMTCIKDQLDNCVQGRNSVPKWITSGRTTLNMKDANKGTVASNFRPITCLLLMWKLLMDMIAESLCNYLEDSSRLPHEQKGCRKRSRGAKRLIADRKDSASKL